MSDQSRDQVNAVYYELTKRSVRRAHPNRPEEVKRRIKKALDESKRLPLIVFWGGNKESPRGEADEADETALHLLQKLVGEVEAGGCVVDLTLLVCDVHSLLSGWSEDETRKYVESLKPLAKRNGFAIELLSKAYEEHDDVKAATEAREKTVQLLSDRDFKALMERV